MPTCYEYDPETGRGCREFGRKSTACLTCKGNDSSREDNHQGQTFVDFDAVPESLLAHVEFERSDERKSTIEFIRVIMGISTIDREILLRRVSGDSLKRIAWRIEREFKKKISLQAVYQRLLKLTKMHEMAEILLLEKRRGKA